MAVPASPLPPPRADYVADLRAVPSAREAFSAWLSTVVLLSLLLLIGPFFIPWAHDGRFNVDLSFGKGELFGFDFAVFAAALSRWLMREGNTNKMLRSISIAGMVATAIALTLLWFDSFEVQTSQSSKLFFKSSQVVWGSCVLAGLSLICGAATEVVYARSLKRSAVVVK